MTRSPSSTASSDLYTASEPEIPNGSDPFGQRTPLQTTNGIHTAWSDSSSNLLAPDSVSKVFQTIDQESHNDKGEVGHTSQETGVGDKSIEQHQRKRKHDSGVSYHGDQQLYEASNIDDLRLNNHELPSRQMESDHKRLKSTNLLTERDGSGEARFDLSAKTAIVSGLPIHIWQRVFCFVPPVFLGRLLRVNRIFNASLTPDTYPKPLEERTGTGTSRSLSAAAIWTASRRKFCPGLPRPLQGQQDLDMWRLLRGSDCQLCREKKTLLTASTGMDIWKAGPGISGVRVVWPFGIRCCGACLQMQSEQVK